MSSQTTRVCKLLAIALSCVLLLQFVTAQGATAFVVSAEDAPQSATTTSDGTESSADTPLDILYEDTSRREANVKHFVMSDHTGKAVVYAEPVHYEVDGKWIDIDNRLASEDAADADDVNGYANTANSFRIKFANNINSSKLVRIKADDYQISWGYVSDTKRSASGTVKARTDIEPATVDEKISAAVANTSSAITYPYVEENMSLQYVVTSTGVKENIIVHSSADTYTYRFEIKAKDVTLVTQDDGSICVVSDGTGETVFTMPAPYMYDDSGRFSTAVTYTLANVKNNKAELIVTADPEWINSPDTAFPVTIDPIMQTRQHRDYIDSTFIADNANYQSSNFHTSNHMLLVGWNPSDDDTTGYDHTRSLLKFTLPTLNKGDMVIAANLAFNMYNYSSYTGGAIQLDAYAVSTTWDAASTTWANQPSYSAIIDDYAFIKPLSEMTATSGWIYFDITRTYKQWHEGKKANYGIMIRQHVEATYATSGWQNYAATGYFHSERYYTVEGAYPAIVIDYRNNKGLEDYWTYTGLTAGVAGTAYINDYSGNLVFTAPVLTSPSERMPLSLSATYNGYNSNQVYACSTSTSDPSALTTVARGWRFSIQQTLLPSSQFGLTGTSQTTYPYVYTDADGTDHYFKKETENGATVYRDEDGLGLTLTFPGSGTPYRITDEKNNILDFNAAGNLFKATDSNGNSMSVAFLPAATSGHTTKVDAGEKIDYILDGVGNKYTFDYEDYSATVKSNYLRAIIDPYGREVVFTRSAGALSSITYPDGTASTFTYETADARSLLTAADDSGYQLSFTYTALATGKQVASVTEYSAPDSAGTRLTGQTITFDRTEYNTTKIRTAGQDNVHGNEDDLETVCQFDNAGRLTSAQTHKISGTNAGATSVRYQNSTNLKQQNRVATSASFGKNIVNLLRNGSGELGTSAWTSASTNATSTFAASTAEAYYGVKSLAITNTAVTAQNGNALLYQDVTVLSGHTVTLSAYVKTANISTVYSTSPRGGYLYIDTRNSSGSIARVRSDLRTGSSNENFNDGWFRLSATITIPADCTKVRVYLALANVTGTVYFDGVQLEYSSFAHPYNMLETSSFEISSGGIPILWQNNGVSYTTSGSTILQGRTNEKAKEGTYSFRIQGDPSTDRYLEHTVPITGDPNDSYIISGWACGYPISTAHHQYSKFELSVIVNYTKADGTTFRESKSPARFNTSITDWQYSAQAIPVRSTTDPSATPVSIVIRARYAYLANYVFFDQVQLIKDSTQSYTYDEDGNVISVSANAEDQSTMTYDGPDLTSVTDTVGYQYSYTYDDNHNLKTATSAGGVKTTFSYNDYGQVTAGEVSNTDDTLAIRSDIGYTGNGAHVEYVEDAHGEQTLYTYDDQQRLSKITDPTGKATAYTYVSTSDDKVRSVAAGGSTVSYTYDGNRLQTLTFGSDTFTFNVDRFGNTISTVINGTTLATNTYAANNGPLTNVTYGNGDVRTYGYNWMNALASVGDGTNTLHTWVYDDNNHLSVYKDLVANRHWRYQFDSIGRLALIHIFNAGGLWLGEANYSYDQRNNIDHLACWFGGQPYYQWYVYDAIAGQPETATYAKDNLPVRYSMATDRHLDYDYDGLNRLTTKTLNTTTPIITNYAYHLSARNQDAESRYQTTQVEVEIVGDIAYRYTYDTNGNITRIEKGERTGTNTAGNFTDYRIYTYNGRGDLEQEHNIALNLSTRYVYDGYGNISFKVLFPYGGNSVTDLIERPVYTYTNGTWSHMLTDYNGQAITYDAIGNPLSYMGATLTWQNGRQLASYTKGDTAISYTYDADGLRTSKTVNGVKHDYYYLDGKLVYEGVGTDDILYYYDSYGTFAGLQYFPNGSNSVMYYAATNMQGDVIGLYDSTGALVVSYEYDAWGKLLSVTDTSSNAIGAINPFRYRGYYYDIETGLYYLQSRYYDPEVGRFINADGYVSTGQDVFGHNPYLYCANNPVNRVDEAGTCYYNANGEWRHDNWEYLGGYVRKPDPNATTISTPKEPALIVPTPPDLTSSAYREDNALYNAGFEGQCTWYAYGRALEVAGVRMPTRDAKKWYDATNLNKGSEIRSNSVAVFSSSQWGHVVYIEVWDPATNTVIFSEGNLKNIPDGEFQTNTLDYLLYRWSDYTLVGYIYTD